MTKEAFPYWASFMPGGSGEAESAASFWGCAPHCIMCLGPSGFARWQDWEYDIAVAQEVEGAAKLLPLQLEGGPPPKEGRLAMKRLLGKAVPWSCEDIVRFANS